jgi:dienelactone hydrolase
MMGGAKAHYDGIVAFSQTDFTEDLKKITVPVLVMHSEDDQIVPYAASGPLSAKLLKNGTLKTYKDFPRRIPTTQADTINSDLLASSRTRGSVACQSVTAPAVSANIGGAITARTGISSASISIGAVKGAAREY